MIDLMDMPLYMYNYLTKVNFDKNQALIKEQELKKQEEEKKKADARQRVPGRTQAPQAKASPGPIESEIISEQLEEAFEELGG